MWYPVLPGAAFQNSCLFRGGMEIWLGLVGAALGSGLRARVKVCVPEDGGGPSYSQTQTMLLRCPKKYDGIIESHWVGRDPKDQQVPTPCHRANNLQIRYWTRLPKPPPNLLLNTPGMGQ